MKTLEEWRDEIDATDRDLVRLLNQRAQCVLALAPLKRQRGTPVHAPDREDTVLSNVRAANQGPLGNRALEKIYSTVIEEMRELQRDLDG